MSEFETILYDDELWPESSPIRFQLSQLRTGSQCLIYSPTKKKWLKGEIYCQYWFDDEEWLLLRYNQGDIEILQRFSKYLRPMTIAMEIDPDNDVDVDRINGNILQRVYDPEILQQIVAALRAVDGVLDFNIYFSLIII